MISLIYGGSGSGKSEYGEREAMRKGGKLKYIATMMPYGDETLKKIERHKEMRSGKGFETIECYRDIGKLDIDKDDTILLECMSNLCANEFFADGADRGRIAEKISREIEKIGKKCANIIIVSNNIFDDGVKYDSETAAYMECLAGINRNIAKMADNVTEVVCGIDIKIKG